MYHRMYEDYYEQIHDENYNQFLMEQEKQKSKKGFASMSEEKRKEIARKGGLAVAQNREHMAEIGRKGGQTVSKNLVHMATIGTKGGTTTARDSKHMAEIGRHAIRGKQKRKK